MTDAPEIDGYTDFELLGSGGFSTVWRANQTAFSRRVALKVLSAVETDAEVLRRFTRECQSAGALSWHPNIVVVFDQGVTVDGRPYLAMEHLPGGSLADAIERGPMGWEDAVAATIQIADALAAAHDAGLMHRDVKPANVLRDRFGDAKLADFGIAAVHGAKETATGVVTASVAHAPPEILAGERASVSTDVYSLGSTLFALLHGGPAFSTRGQTVAQIIGRVLNEPVPDLSSDGVPDDVAAVVARAMAKNPADRFSSAAALGASLQGAQTANAVPVTQMRTVGHQDAPGGVDQPDPLDTRIVPAGLGTAADHDPVEPPVAAGDVATPSVPVPSEPVPPEPGPSEPVLERIELPDAEPRQRSARGRGPLIGALVALVVVAAVIGGWLATRDGDTDVTAPSTVPPTSLVDESGQSTTTAPATSVPPTSQPPTSVAPSSTPRPTRPPPTTGPAPTTIPTPAEQAVELARILATAIAVDDWETAGAIDIDKAAWTVEQWEFGYGPLVRSEIIEYDVIPLGAGVFELSLGLVAYEIAGTDQITRLFCVTWIAEPLAGTVRQTAGATQLPFRTGWISIADADAALRPEC